MTTFIDVKTGKQFCGKDIGNCECVDCLKLEAPNLDAMTVYDLMQVSLGSAHDSLVREYAANKVDAMVCRQNGAIAMALKYEQHCERIYNRLAPKDRW